MSFFFSGIPIYLLVSLGTNEVLVTLVKSGSAVNLPRPPEGPYRAFSPFHGRPQTLRALDIWIRHHCASLSVTTVHLRDIIIYFAYIHSIYILFLEDGVV